MKQRALENYLSPAAIFEACGVQIEFSETDDVTEILARTMYFERHPQDSWLQLPARSRKRRRDKLKKWLNTSAVERMTPERLAQSDPDGEIRCWLQTIGRFCAVSR